MIKNLTVFKERFSRIFIGLSSFQMLAMFRRGLFYSYLSIYLRYFLGLSVTETTLFATLPMVLNVSFQTFVWGVLSDKFQLRRTLVIGGEVLAGIGTIIVFYSHRLVDEKFIAGWIVILGLSIVEIFWSMSNTGWTALISDLYSLEKRIEVQGNLASLGGIGRIVGVWVGGLLYDGFQLSSYFKDWVFYEGWGFYEGPLFFVAAGVMFLSTIPMVFIPEGGIEYESRSLEQDKFQIEKKTTSSNQIFIVFVIALAFINFGRNSIAIIIPQFLVLESGFAVSSELLSYIINTQSVAIVLMGFIVGGISFHLGNGKTMLFGAGMAVLALIMFVSTDLFLIFVASFLRGASQAIILASAYAFASGLIAPRNRAKLFGIYNATFFLSWGLAGTILAGPIIDLLIMTGTSELLAYKASFLVAGLVTLVGIVILIFLLLWMRTKEMSENLNK
ncbi:MAG: MFS transporter [Candidatus Heimdallarchaeota archaeon]|nr:MAG: MFS transporter [Candidatus Heimdallarchaeota archaeon]